MTALPLQQTDGNSEVHRTCGNLVARQIAGSFFDGSEVAIGPLSTNYFSFTFTVETQVSGLHQSVFVKIPKALPLRGNNSKSILPISPQDRCMGEEEAKSLNFLAEKWKSDELKVSWVRLRSFLSEYNAVVTDRITAVEALDLFRKLDLRRRFGFQKDARRLREAMARLGAALGKFHQGEAQRGVFRASSTIPKIESYCRKLLTSVDSQWLKKTLAVIPNLAGLEITGIEVPTLKGIDIRNVLIDGHDNLFLLDPGRIKRTFREADLARFIMTYRILYWGSKVFFLGLQPDPVGEEAFLKAYYEHSSPASPQLLSFYLLKEQLKHWDTAIDSLQMLSFPSLVKGLIAKTYVNPFYNRQLSAELKNIINITPGDKL